MINMNVDLHCHSTNSDGTKSVEEILKMAEIKKIHTLSITDHDNLKGSIEAFELNHSKKIFSGNLVAGIEISTEVDKYNVHLLAYFPSISKVRDSKVNKILLKIQESRLNRMQKMVEKANKLGLKVTYEEVVQEAKLGEGSTNQPADVIGRPHLARVFIKKGYVSNVDEAFQIYMARGKPLYEARYTLEYKEWVKLIHENDGMVVWAHPLVARNEDLDVLKFVGDRLIEAGIDGIEYVYRYKGKYPVPDGFIIEGNQVLKKLIKTNELLITSGGDYHGDVGVLGALELSRIDLEKFINKLNLEKFKA
jgi:3',5'-nucleoside bisphosphate phosphatase